MIQPGEDKNARARAGAPARRPKALPGVRVNLASPEAQVHAEASRILGARLSARLRGGNACHVLRDGTEAYPEMLAAISSARRRIFFEIYILRDDRWGTRFFDALLERARAGIEIYIIYDAFGALESRDLFVALRGAGAHVLEYNPFRWLAKFRRLNRRDHRKILVVDGEVGFLGGLNIGNEYIEPGIELPFRDTHLRVRGPMVGQLEEAFVELWRHETGERLRRLHPPRKDSGNGVGLILAKTPIAGRLLLAKAHRALFRNASRRIWIANAYFVPTRRIRLALLRAARRGTDVRLLLPGPTDAPLARWASRAQYPALLHAGVRIFEYRARVLHSKTVLVDDAWALVGSTNLDHRSFHFNLEVLAVMHDPAAADELEAHWQADLEQSEEILIEHCQNRSWWESLLYRFAYLFRRWM